MFFPQGIPVKKKNTNSLENASRDIELICQLK